MNSCDTDHDDGCGEQGEGAGAVGPKPEQVGTRNKKLRWEATLTICRNRDERRGRQGGRHMTDRGDEYEQQVVKTGAWSTGLEGRVGHDSWKVGPSTSRVSETRDTCDTGWTRCQKRGHTVREEGRNR